MVTEVLPDDHRTLIVNLVTQAWVEIRDDPFLSANAQECLDIMSRLSGTDTRVTVERAYPSSAARNGR